jgi:hypothetical protein
MDMRAHTMILFHPRAVAFIIGILILTAGCSPAPINTNELLKKKAIYNNQMVTVKGCFTRLLESTILFPCSDSNYEEAICIESFRRIEECNKWMPGYADGYKKMEKELSEKEKRLENQLSKLEQGKIAGVVFRGEFRSSDEPIFGNAFKYELIVHSVLSITSERRESK